MLIISAHVDLICLVAKFLLFLFDWIYVVLEQLFASEFPIFSHFLFWKFYISLDLCVCLVTCFYRFLSIFIIFLLAFSGRFVYVALLLYFPSILFSFPIQSCICPQFNFAALARQLSVYLSPLSFLGILQSVIRDNQLLLLR